MPWPLLSYTRVLSLLGFKFAVSVQEDDLEALFATGRALDYMTACCRIPGFWLQSTPILSADTGAMRAVLSDLEVSGLLSRRLLQD
jgi:hypothetical protein